MNVKVEYLGVEASGKNLTEAKKNAAAKVSKILRTPPKLYAHRGHALMVSAGLDGGGRYTLSNPTASGVVNGCCFCASFEDAVESGIKHMLNIARERWEHHVPDWAPEKLRRLLPAEWHAYDTWQECYEHARATGMKDVDAHRWASDNDRGFRDAGSPDEIRAAIKKDLEGQPKPEGETHQAGRRAAAPGM